MKQDMNRQDTAESLPRSRYMMVTETGEINLTGSPSGAQGAMKWSARSLHKHHGGGGGGGVKTKEFIHTKKIPKMEIHTKF
jgi:hypothetical protein